jgi:hypothetical protein
MTWRERLTDLLLKNATTIIFNNVFLGLYPASINP